MLGTILKNLFRPHAPKVSAKTYSAAAPLRLHIGGQQPHPDWKIVNVQPGPHADFVQSCTDLSVFADASVEEIYASHVVEHLKYQRELGATLEEFNRVLVPGGKLHVSVPDLTTLCTLFLDPSLDGTARFQVMRMMYGGQVDDSDFHYVGLTHEFLNHYLERAGFVDIERVRDLGLFHDTSRMVFRGYLISLNVRARKPLTASEAPANQRDG